MTRSDDARLVLLVAPPGYGKSTLLAEWAGHDARSFIWVQADGRGRGESGLVAAIAEAFEGAGWISRKRALRGQLTAAELGQQARLLARAGHRYVLVIDDAHLVASSVLSHVAGALLAELAPGSCLALASRSEPTLPLGRLRAHRSLIEIRPDDLRMRPAEAAGLLRRAGAELEFEAIQTLVRRTEGWPAGLYLGALTVGSQDESAAGLETFDGDNHLVTEYLRDECLDEASPELLSFMARTSVLDELSGPLCDAVLQQQGSGQTLARLARGNLMLMPLDQMHERFRWHRLFRSMLKAELHRTEPQLEAQLHRHAGDWLAQHGDLDGAISQAVLAGDVTRAGQLLWSQLAHYVGLGRAEALKDWLSRFRAEDVAECASLAVAAAHGHLVNGNVEQARYWGLMAAGAKVDPGQSRSASSLKAAIAIIDAATTTTDVAHMAQAAQKAYALEPAHGAWRPMCCLLTGAAAHLAGDRAAAKERLEEGLQLGGGRAPGMAALSLAQLTLIAIEQNEWEMATDLADRAAAMVEEHPSLAAWPVSAIVFAASAAALAHDGRVDQAKAAFGRASELLAALGAFIPWYGAESRIMLASAALGLADTVRARTLLAEASRMARRTRGAVIFQPHFDELWAQIDSLAEAALSGPSSLTIAELRILRFMPSHRSFREIAERLGVSVNTVKTQAHAIYRKLDAASRSEAVARASSAGLL